MNLDPLVIPSRRRAPLVYVQIRPIPPGPKVHRSGCRHCHRDLASGEAVRSIMCYCACLCLYMSHWGISFLLAGVVREPQRNVLRVAAAASEDKWSMAECFVASARKCDKDLVLDYE